MVKPSLYHPTVSSFLLGRLGTLPKSKFSYVKILAVKKHRRHDLGLQHTQNNIPWFKEQMLKHELIIALPLSQSSHGISSCALQHSSQEVLSMIYIQVLWSIISSILFPNFYFSKSLLSCNPFIFSVWLFLLILNAICFHFVFGIIHTWFNSSSASHRLFFSKKPLVTMALSPEIFFSLLVCNFLYA